ncbi:Probable gluconokinase, partial [Geodia barretti]
MVWLVVVLTGACGSGKTAVGHVLAEEEKAVFIEADDFHTPENISNMGKGQPLTDQDRHPWLEALHEALYQAASESSVEGRVRVVVACSALKKSYRDIILGRGKGARDLSRRCVVVQLTASQEVLTSRVAERRGHFMPPSLVTSQLAVLEPLSAQEWPCLTCPTL